SDEEFDEISKDEISKELPVGGYKALEIHRETFSELAKSLRKTNPMEKIIERVLISCNDVGINTSEFEMLYRKNQQIALSNEIDWFKEKYNLDENLNSEELLNELESGNINQPSNVKIAMYEYLKCFNETSDFTESRISDLSSELVEEVEDEEEQEGIGI
ncbi:MAG: hypothetical protein EBR50_06965, partial [Proteobacteria bacterium]|nr:hypothetical protein [Pseudomonadota bacterium]